MIRTSLCAAACAVAVFGAAAQVRVGVTVSSSGPQASLGIPEVNAVALLPRTIGSTTIDYTVLDDASDPTRAVLNVRKLIDQSHVDLVIGSSTTPNTLAMIDPAAEGQTPVISLGSSARLVEPQDAKRRWIFKTPHSDSQMASSILEHFVAHGGHALAYIGFNNALGEAFWEQISLYAGARKVEIVASERFAPTDASVTAQILKIVAAHPDGVVIGASGTPAVTPARALADRGFKGAIYFNHGVSNRDFLALCGSACEGAFVPTGPIMVAAQLSADVPSRAEALRFAQRYDARYGAGSVNLFAAYTNDIGLLLERAVPVALQGGAAPGTAAFRAALRDALEQIRNLTTSTGVVNMSPTDHVGLDQRSRVMVQIHDGGWRLAR
jgi:branched-chain amino acid transport system substrate-binding protein